ncbi:MAG: MoxR family ATPase, partial [Bdellovibrionales bacterium]|nr:MoxR family ATPase [Bdellovibrionales bacterium]
ALTQAIDAHMSRVQFTPDLLPSDIVGSEIYHPDTGSFSIRKGPIFTNLLLADEINRAPAKVQSALLQAMEERKVTIGLETFRLQQPFLVLATQNPIEQEGTYPLPEAQVDRFLLKIRVSYPSFEDELSILRLVCDEDSSKDVEQCMTAQQLLDCRIQANQVFVDERLDRYIVALIQATRNLDEYGLEGLSDLGASPRASIALRKCARALAYMQGRDFVTPDDVKEMAYDVLRHRIILNYEAETKSINTDDVISVLLKKVSVP